MSSFSDKIITALWPWKNTTATGIYELVLKPAMSLLQNDNEQTFSEMRLSMISRPNYVSEIVKETYKSMRLAKGGSLPLKVKVASRTRSQSLRYGLAGTDHSIQITGKKSFVEEFSALLKSSLLRGQLDGPRDVEHLSFQNPENTLVMPSTITVNSSPIVASGNGGLVKSLGVAGILLGIVAALAWFSNTQKPGPEDPLRTAIDHLRKRVPDELQLLTRETVNGGEKFYFQGRTENYTVVVDKDGRVYSWSRTPSGGHGASLA